MASLSMLIDRVHSGKSAVELAYTSHEQWPLPRSSIGDVLHVSVLDSSFNPPTLAHLALANAPCPFSLDSSTSARGPPDYDAVLLLLSVRNADKKLNPGDATYVQRLEMMILLAKDIVRHQPDPNILDHMQRSDSPVPLHTNVAVAIIDEPTFVGKSKTLLQFLRHRLSLIHASCTTADPPMVDVQLAAALNRPVSPKLTFLVGMDTLERLFAPRYYPSEQAMLDSLRRLFSSDHDDARVVCARRALSGGLRKEDEEERKVLDVGHEFLLANRVTVIDIGEHERNISSTEIRNLLRMGDFTWREKVTPLVAEYVAERGLYRTP